MFGMMENLHFSSKTILENMFLVMQSENSVPDSHERDKSYPSIHMSVPTANFVSDNYTQQGNETCYL